MRRSMRNGYFSQISRFVHSYIELKLTHISLASHFWDIGKQCRPRSDAKQRSILTQGLHCLLHIKVRLAVLLYAVKTVEGDFRFAGRSPNVGQTHKEIEFFI